MIIPIDELASIIGADVSEGQHLPEVDWWVYKLTGTKADAVYGDVGKGNCEVISIIPKVEPIETVLKAVLTASEVEGGS